MDHRSAVITIVLVFAAASHSVAQSTGLPTFTSPYRSFTRYEFGGTLSFPDKGGGPIGGDGVALEGHYGFATKELDVEIRGGVFDRDRPGDVVFLTGVSVRKQVLTRSEEFPLDGALIAGIGGQFVSNFTTLVVPVGLSVGRRFNAEESIVSIVPFAQPTVFLTAGDGQDLDVAIALGFGADVQLSTRFGARLSLGLGDVQGISVSAVWIR